LDEQCGRFPRDYTGVDRTDALILMEKGQDKARHGKVEGPHRLEEKDYTGQPCIV
jgi:hypothetical protein